MKKILTLAAVLVAALAMNAQAIRFGDAAVSSSDFGATRQFKSADETLVLDVTNGNTKFAIDQNKQKFGTSASDFTQETWRMKTGGASGSKSAMVVTVPSDGTLKISARSGDSSKPRYLVIKQGETELLKQALDDNDAVTATVGEDEVKIFPIYSAEVKAGAVNLEYGVGVTEGNNGSVSFYAIEFVPKSATNIDNTAVEGKVVKTFENGQLVVIKNGVKYNATGAVIR